MNSGVLQQRKDQKLQIKYTTSGKHKTELETVVEPQKVVKKVRPGSAMPPIPKSRKRLT